MKIYLTSGDSYGEPGLEYTEAEAADIAERSAWAAMDGGDLVIGRYRLRTSIQNTAVRGEAMARRLRKMANA